MSAVKKTKNETSPDEFVLMRRTRALMGEAWDLWRTELENTPAVAKRVLTQAIHELHAAETSLLKGKTLPTKSAIKKKAVKAVKSVKTKAVKAVKAKVKKARNTSKRAK